MTSKMTTNSQLLTTELKNKNKNEVSKQLEQEQNHRHGDHMEGYQQGGRRGRVGKKIQGIRTINVRYKIDKGRLRIVWETEKPKNLYVQPMDMNQVGECWWEGWCRAKGNKGKNKMGQLLYHSQ